MGLRFRARHAHMGDFGVRIRNSGDVVVANLRAGRQDGIAQRDLGHVFGDVGELHRPGDVADAPHRASAAAQVGVDRDCTAHRLHTGGLQSQPVGEGATTGGHEDLVDRCALASIHLQHLAPAFRFDRDHRCAHLDIDPFRTQIILHESGHFGILVDEDGGGHLQDGDPGAQTREDLCEFGSDRPAAQNGDGFGQFVLVEHILVGPVPGFGQSRDRRHRGHGARRDHETFGTDRTDALDLHRGGVQKTGRAEVDRDPHVAEALGVVVMGDGAARGPHSFHDGAEIVPLFGLAQAECGGAVHLPREAARCDQRLGGHASGPEAVSAEGRLFDDCRVHPEIGGSRGGNQSSGAASDRNQIVLCRHLG